MGEPEDHHVIPVMHLKRFCDENKKIWVYNKNFHAKAPRCVSPRGAFYRKHEYTIVHKDGSKDYKVEKTLSKFETTISRLIRYIVREIRSGRPPSLGPMQRISLHVYFVMCWRRSREAFREAVNEEYAEKLLDETIQSFEREKRPLTEAEKLWLVDPSARQRILANARAESQLTGGREVIEALGRRELAFVSITNPKKSFVIGSRPVLKLTTERTSDLSDESVEAWLPLASDIAVTPGKKGGGVTLIKLDSTLHIRMINHGIAKQSDTIGGKSKELIASLIDPR